MKNNSVTIGIPTCYSGQSLVRAVESIRNAGSGSTSRIVIRADRTPISASVKKQLTALKTIIGWNPTEGSQFKKLKQLIDTCNDELFIFTQDDVIFEKNTVDEIIQCFRMNPDATMVAIRILPLAPQTFIEASLTSMVRIVDTVAGIWNGGDNYLAASGRCLAFRTSHLKKFNIREHIVNGDMYLYLENKRLDGTMTRLKRGCVYIRCPQKLSDQVGPSTRFQYSKKEMKKYFPNLSDNEYNMPKLILLYAVMKEFLTHPIPLAGYFYILFYTRIRALYETKSLTPLWSVDASTK